MVVDRNRQTWTLGTDLGIWWEFGGNLVELSEPDFQGVNIGRWEFGGNLVGIWWEFGGNLVGRKINLWVYFCRRIINL
jgi:hypothetical protein